VIDQPFSDRSAHRAGSDYCNDNGHDGLASD